jgi:probable rRNA maturation factor
MKAGVQPQNRGNIASPETLGSIDIQIINSQRTKKINTRLLKQITLELFKELKVAQAELGVRLVGAKEMARINWQFLQHEGSTDVITFDHIESKSKVRSPKSEVHGELFICVDDAILQARQFGTEWQSEVVRYVIHGILHLLGHDDLKPAPRREMKRAENRLVRLLAKKISFTQLSHPR